MKFWTDKQGNELTFKQFMKRWKSGLEGITQLQQAKGQISGTYITVLGIIFGIIVSFFNWQSFWWLIIILIGALINTLVGLLGLYQKYWQLKKIDQMFKITEEDKGGYENVEVKE